MIEIGADINAGKCGETPLCVAVHSSKQRVRMVESLLEHEITNVNVREALKISWELHLDSITGLLLEHISVDRSRDSVNLSGLELTTLKPLWILPSLGIRMLLETKQHRRHKKQRSLGHVKEFLIRRKSIATDVAAELDSDGVSSAESNKRDSRKLSVDFSSLKYVSDVDAASESEETDFGFMKSGEELEKSTKRARNFVSGLNPIIDSSAFEIADQVESVNANDDSGVATLHQLTSCQSLTTKLAVDKKPGVIYGIMSRNSLRRLSHDTVSGATTLPYSTLDQYTLNSKAGRSMSERSDSCSVVDHGSLSPSQLIKKMRRHHRKSGSKRFMNESSGSSARADSPIPVLYSPYQYDGEDSFALTSFTERSLSLDHANEDSPMNCSEFSTSTGSSPSGQLGGDSRNTSTDTTSSAGVDEIDFSVCAPIPEEPSEKKEENSHLIKMLDLSSNKLTDFKAFNHSEYGELVFKQLKDLTSLDMKQNSLSELLSAMMKVRTYACIHN